MAYYHRDKDTPVEDVVKDLMDSYLFVNVLEFTDQELKYIQDHIFLCECCKTWTCHSAGEDYTCDLCIGA